MAEIIGCDQAHVEIFCCGRVQEEGMVRLFFCGWAFVEREWDACMSLRLKEQRDEFESVIS